MNQDREALLKGFIDEGWRLRRIAPLPPSATRGEHKFALNILRTLVDNCPFCGTTPSIGPAEPWNTGNAYGFVQCENSRCAARPTVRDDSNVADERGSAAYIALAIRRWNRRP